MKQRQHYPSGDYDDLWLKRGPLPRQWNSAEETGGTIITIHTASNQTASVDVQHIPIS